MRQRDQRQRRAKKQGLSGREACDCYIAGRRHGVYTDVRLYAGGG